MRKLFLVILTCLSFLFSGEAIGQITMTGGGGGGSDAITETSTTYTITKTNIVLAGDVTVTSISFVTVVATTSITLGSNALNTKGIIDVVSDGGATYRISIGNSDNALFTGATGNWSFDNDILVGDDIQVTDDVVLNDGSVVGISGNEIITFNAAGSINFTGATVDIDGAFTASTVTSDGAIIAETSLTINPTVVDTEDPSFIIKSDANSNSPAITSETLTIKLTAAIDPTDAFWTLSPSQAIGFEFYGDYFGFRQEAGSPDFLTIDIATGNVVIASGDNLDFRSPDRFIFNQTANQPAGSVFSVISNFNLTDTNGRQGWLLLNAKVAQSGTAAFDGLFVNATLTSLGDGSTGDGNNLLNLSVSGTPKFLFSTAGDFTMSAGDAEIYDTGDLASESLADITNFGTGNWSYTGEIVADGTDATFTWASSGVGTMTQTSGNMTISGVGSRWYKLAYTITNSTVADETVTITTAFAASTTELDVSSAAAYTVYFKSAASPANFVISITGAGSGAFTITEISLKEVNGGDIAVHGLITGGGSAGIKVFANGDVTTTGITKIVGLNQPGVTVTNASSYAVLAANTGKRHIIGDLGQVCTITLPAEAAGLNYEFWYYGAAAETDDHIILTNGGNAKNFKGGVVFLDVANAISQSNSNGSSNSSLTLNNMNGGTFIKMFCDGTNWFVTGTMVSDVAPTWADQ